MENILTQKASFDIATREGAVKLYNAQSAVGVSLKDVPEGNDIEIEGVAVYPEVNEAGDDVLATALFGTDGIVYSSISPSVADGATKIIDGYHIFAEEGILNVKVTSGTSNAGRKYLTLAISY